LEAIQRGEYLITGFRNRDIRDIIYGAAPEDVRAHRRQSSRVGRLLALLRAHGLIKKIPKTHRYQVTTAGQMKLAAISAARKASIEKLTSAT
jgi:hypothetical protein